ncbi:MAG TPA: hypothetical protein PKN87_06120 [Syntrophomonadaceae bacterium]|nr:hypothetical protein [Syntrophomonadaceae bacterium]HPR93728.1 hypothetical protein [Syntrophomonadaceae bacterium]
MKGHIAFCPHFHQPHFQLHRTREEAFVNSYQPWLELLTKAVEMKGYYINLHFSGPFLYWLQDQKPDYIKDFKKLLASNKIGIIGGLADEPFIQLSSRRDDFYYQLKKYDELMYETTGVSAEQWQGIHLVERECGEMVLSEVAYAAGLLNTPALFYLDAETFYEGHFSYPGSESDYARKHFGFNDPFSKTTISHLPQDILYFALRDEIGGQQFTALPVHSQLRYKLLKRNGFTADDQIRIKPRHYFFYIKDVLEKAAHLVKEYGKPEIEPVAVIFEDAEKFGQWSKDPAGDTQWLMEFFELVEQDEEISFIGLKDYLKQQGILDTYPVKSSHSYKEWENWTAKRGIRGVTFGDERLRRVICRLRDVEAVQNDFETAVISSWAEGKFDDTEQALQEQTIRSLLQSAERFDIVSAIIKEKYADETSSQYETINRIRNLVYQEDPKWASRHPSYGSSPYYDMQGLAYLEAAYRIMSALNTKIGLPQPEKFALRDWDMDGRDEIVIFAADQFAVIDTKGGCICFQQVIDEVIAEDTNKAHALIAADIGSGVKAYNSIYRYSYPLVFTEADSSIGTRYYAEGGRQEICRNSLRCELYWQYDDQMTALGNLLRREFSVKNVTSNESGVSVELTCPFRVKIEGRILEILVSKSFQTGPQSMTVTVKAEVRGDLDKGQLILVPQLITSATPSDEIDFKPRAFLGLAGQSDREAEYVIKDISILTAEGIKYEQSKFSFNHPDSIDYIYELKNGGGDSFNNRVSFNIKNSSLLQKVTVEPAVRNYYRDYVFEDQSRLGYHSSGLAILPALPLIDNIAFIETEIKWELNTAVKAEDYKKVCCLIENE